MKISSLIFWAWLILTLLNILEWSVDAFGLVSHVDHTHSMGWEHLLYQSANAIFFAMWPGVWKDYRANKTSKKSEVK